ncbi:pyridoxamine 5'-phosphate oxidase [Photobacterium sp. J15]|uniref:pyridoxamine 5'-phosphate oxidase n=1 Tax=Photobacterium sp. J15 TaxID=265901 RepID=UPI0007E3957A|nr:pyridoxamine 5'-phosphate oxidase [Photobacterium sp. J15]
MELSDIRREYTRGGLRRNDLPDEPLSLFDKWLKQAIEANLTDPTAMTVATVDEDGQPYQRIVLLKHFDKDGFVFYTNLGSRKALHLSNNAKISLHFPWHPIERQVHITGQAEKLSKLEVMKYFASRPKESQIAAWASKQSSRLSARGVLEGKFFELKQKFANGEVPLPTFWGGYRVRVNSIEFWQGGENRLHDRFLYSLEDENWSVERLAP